MMILMSAVLALLPIIILFREVKKTDKKAEEERPLKYYLACKNEGLESLYTQSQKEKAKLIAKSILGEKGAENYEEIFEEGKKQEAENIKAARNIELQEQRAEERDIWRRMDRFSDCVGRDKRVRMLQQEMNANIETAKIYRKGGQAILSLSQQKEISWGLTGGFASGIAGPAAGIAAASHTQATNAQIRQQNAEYMRLNGPAIANSYNYAHQCEERVKELRAAIEKIKIKLVEDIPESELIEKLYFENEQVTFSETGALTIQVSVKASAGVMIFDSTPACIDGTIQAEFYQNDKVVGKALMVLPKYGIRQRECTLQGMCLSGVNQDIPFNVKYEPYHLWAMEV